MAEYTGRKRGAPLGNHNRLKHGFYSKRLKVMGVDEALELTEDLVEELALVRSFLRKFAELGEETVDVTKMRTILDGLGIAAVRISALVRTQKALGERMDEADLPKVIEEVLAEMGRKGRGKENKSTDCTDNSDEEKGDEILNE